MLAALLVAGCSAAPSASPVAFGQVTARIVAAHDDRVIEVRTVGPRAIAQADLILADGTRDPAYSIDAERNPEAGGQTPAGGASSFVNTGTTNLVGAIASVALIRIDYPADYAISWQKARVVVRLGYGADTVQQILAAPPPAK